MSPRPDIMTNHMRVVRSVRESALLSVLATTAVIPTALHVMRDRQEQKSTPEVVRRGAATLADYFLWPGFTIARSIHIEHKNPQADHAEKERIERETRWNPYNLAGLALDALTTGIIAFSVVHGVQNHEAINPWGILGEKLLANGVTFFGGYLLNDRVNVPQR